MKVDWPFGPGQSAQVKAFISLPVCDLTAPELAQAYAFLCLIEGPRSPRALEMLEQLELRESMLDDYVHGKFADTTEIAGLLTDAVEEVISDFAREKPTTIAEAAYEKKVGKSSAQRIATE